MRQRADTSGRQKLIAKMERSVEKRGDSVRKIASNALRDLVILFGSLENGQVELKRGSSGTEL